MKRHLDNFEGALPLLIIGSVLLVYAGILASQELGSKSGHLPLWGLLCGVGAVIVGAGIYSTFLEPEATPAPGPAGDWITVPRAEWEARSGARRVAERTPAAPEPVPIWWEGPPTATRASPSLAPPRAGPARMARTPSPPPSSPVPGRPERPARAVPHPSARYSLRELMDELSELEALVYRSPTAPARRLSNPPSPRPQATTACMDCERTLTPAASPTPCRSCGRGLCARCAASSKSEDGEVCCVECRARES
jgi:hypothetical protein